MASSDAPDTHTAPGPRHVTPEPSPVSQRACVGVARTVTVVNPRVSVASTGAQPAGSSHNHVGTCTNVCRASGGLVSGSGEGGTNRAAATSRMTSGETGGAASTTNSRESAAPPSRQQVTFHHQYSPVGSKPRYATSSSVSGSVTKNSTSSPTRYSPTTAAQ